jgi:hypothetical protein
MNAAWIFAASVGETRFPVDVSGGSAHRRFNKQQRSDHSSIRRPHLSCRARSSKRAGGVPGWRNASAALSRRRETEVVPPLVLPRVPVGLLMATSGMVI